MKQTNCTQYVYRSAEALKRSDHKIKCNRSYSTQPKNQPFQETQTETASEKWRVGTQTRVYLLS
jgi:hypothetical protein